ncbi:stage II sporulation protein E [Paenibacillus sp. FSL R7-0048]|jgi:stage II sporulation protein E|uniref:Stage II sporulation protein E n=1 Tax=Paenibacillus odorifer TaxID=189426 RepID=A0ABX3GK49_9BACL|nr:stage II sporulation protein E [Paenibacillus odorifer]OMC62824.1 stage II sporulation protein E [Paenibacillus odorifer]OMC67080.1 stage II sporulation protein E [Paenibacillus odorifer]OMD28807.1 stage II sporulation protein E [Paenibacillus odorifer]OMD54394.1 stage II sporulation protein E [Paenibacillus odorifer]OMD59102.1 stage II sporulation protein E [Paenibacillus odorifer]
MSKSNVVNLPEWTRVGSEDKKQRQALGTRIIAWGQKQRYIQLITAKKWMLLLSFMGFLLGRAMILDELSPFAVAYFAVIVFMRRDSMLPVAGAIIAGSLFTPFPGALVTTAELIIFFLVYRGLESFERIDLSYAPLMVFVSSFMVGLFKIVLGPSLSWYPFMMTTLDALLGFVLTLVFIQALPLLTYKQKSRSLRNEEVLCLIILLASVMTGLVGWTLNGWSLEHILSRYLILLFAMAGGAPLGAAVGVVTGLILSLADISAIYQMSLLAFSGMLAGMMQGGRKGAVSIGMLLGSTILSVYFTGPGDMMASTWETCAAIVLFLITPKAMISAIAKYVPGTSDHSRSQHEYARRVRDLTAERVTQFSQVFQQLSSSFGQIPRAGEVGKSDREMEDFMNTVTEGACAGCIRRTHCWDAKFYQTYRYMTDMMTTVEECPDITAAQLPPEWSRICGKTGEVLEVMKGQYDLYQHDMRWKRQIYDSRQFVAEQLSGVSQVMEDLAKEIKREGQAMYRQEAQIREALEKLGLSIHGIEILSLDPGRVEIEVVHAYNRGFDECRKMIAPLLSDILDENIAVMSETAVHPREGLSMVTFGSAKAFEVNTGVAVVSKGGDMLSGDSFSTVELGNGTFAVSISDGMGNGERARMESSAALGMLEKLLQSGMDEKLAVKSVNSILLLRSPDEFYATVDMALIDQYSAQTTFMKIASAPSFIRRGSEVIPITSSNLPIGIIKDIDVDLISMQLRPGDILIMMTDGIYDAPGYAVNKEIWMKRMIQELEGDDPQDLADSLLEKVIRYQGNEILDDMTIVVSRLDHFHPEWSSLHMPGIGRMERPRTVS